RGKSHSVLRFERHHHFFVVFDRLGPLRRRLGGDEEKAAQTRLEHIVGLTERFVAGSLQYGVMESAIEFVVGFLVAGAVTFDQLLVNISEAGDFVHVDIRTCELSSKRLKSSENGKDFLHLLARNPNDRRALIGKKANEALGGKNLERFPQRRS